MIFKVRAVDSLKGTIALPASKSYSIRAFLIAACGGSSKIINASNCDDALVAVRTARQLGAKITSLGKDTYRIIAQPAGTQDSKTLIVNVKESGTVLRFVLALLALRRGDFTVVGEGTLRTRPNYFLVRTLQGMGVNIKGRSSKECVPIKIHGGSLHGGVIDIDGGLSSQFISALLIAAPLMKDDTYLHIKGSRFVSQTYVAMTRQILKKAGIKINMLNERLFFVRGGQKFQGLRSFCVPSDYGLAAFFLVAAGLIASDITLHGYLKNDFVQADAMILPLLKRLGAKFTRTKDTLKMRGPFHLKGTDFSLKDAPDLVPIITVAALFAKGPTRLYDIAHVRAKESDRISDLHHELKKIGAKITETKDEIIIYPQPAYKTGILLDPHHDHRLAMAFTVLGLKIGSRIKDMECTHKSYPDFIKDFQRLGVKFEKTES